VRAHHVANRRRESTAADSDDSFTSSNLEASTSHLSLHMLRDPEELAAATTAPSALRTSRGPQSLLRASKQNPSLSTVADDSSNYDSARSAREEDDQAALALAQQPPALARRSSSGSSNGAGTRSSREVMNQVRELDVLVKRLSTEGTALAAALADGSEQTDANTDPSAGRSLSTSAAIRTLKGAYAEMRTRRLRVWGNGKAKGVDWYPPAC